MRKEKWDIDSFVHLIRRGVRGLPIVRGDSDKWRHLKTLFYMNDVHVGIHAIRDVESMINKRQIKLFEWPKSWPKRQPLFTLCAFTLLDTHIHQIGIEKIEKGISKFMHKSGIGTAKYFNLKYGEKGGLFQTPYQARVIDSDEYLRWAVAYVLVKNTFEMHPKGLQWATKNFEDAWEWANHYPFSSFGDYAGTTRNSPIVDTEDLKKILGGPKEFKGLCRDMILGRKEKPLVFE